MYGAYDVSEAVLLKILTRLSEQGKEYTKDNVEQEYDKLMKEVSETKKRHKSRSSSKKDL